MFAEDVSIHLPKHFFRNQDKRGAWINEGMGDWKGGVAKLGISDGYGPVVRSGSIYIDGLGVIFIADVVDEIGFLF